jgi:hypothetical protein
MMKSQGDVIGAMLQWSEDFIEKPNWVFEDLPVCPFAKAARPKKTIQFELMPFDLDDPLEHGGAILSLALSLLRDPALETLFVIHPHPNQVEAHELEAFVARLNERLAASDVTGDLEAFEAHPDSEFSVGGVYTRRAPYPSFQILRRSLLRFAAGLRLLRPVHAGDAPRRRHAKVLRWAVWTGTRFAFSLCEK